MCARLRGEGRGERAETRGACGKALRQRAGKGIAQPAHGLKVPTALALA